MTSAPPDPITTRKARHAYASTALANLVPTPTVSRLLGHRSVVITMRTYAHLVPGTEDVARSVSAAGRFVPGMYHERTGSDRRQRFDLHRDRNQMSAGQDAFVFISNHVLAGALIGSRLRPTSAAVAGFLSHLVMDIFPHHGFGDGPLPLGPARRDGLLGLVGIA